MVHFHQLTIKSAFFPIRILAFFFIWNFRAALGAFFDMFWLLEVVSLRIWRSKLKLASVCFGCIQNNARFTTGSRWWRIKSAVVPLASTCCVRVYTDQREQLDHLSWKLGILIFLWKLRMQFRVLHVFRKFSQSCFNLFFFQSRECNKSVIMNFYYSNNCKLLYCHSFKTKHASNGNKK